MIEAQIVCDSISPQSIRLTTFKLRYPKFIHGEFMTHRVFSRNASSSRAVPVWKNLEEVRSDALRAAPVKWGAEQKGMSPGDELSDTEPSVFDFERSARDSAKYCWREAALRAADIAQSMQETGAHKSIINRIIEPFLHINVIVTATEYMNFFGLRLDKNADPTMRALAEAMWKVYNENTPHKIEYEDWHLPFINDSDWASFIGVQVDPSPELRLFESRSSYSASQMICAIRTSVARCARVSYTSFETGKRSTVEEDLKLYYRLVGAQPVHASPAEHQATPDSFEGAHIQRWGHPDQWGNFRGWCQYRKMLAGESYAPLPEGYVYGR